MSDTMPPGTPNPQPEVGEVRCGFCGELYPLAETVEMGGCRVAMERKDEAVQYLQQGGTLPRLGGPDDAAGSLEIGHLLERSWRTLKPVLGWALLAALPFLITGFAIENLVHELASHRLEVSRLALRRSFEPDDSDWLAAVLWVSPWLIRFFESLVIAPMTYALLRTSVAGAEPSLSTVLKGLAKAPALLLLNLSRLVSMMGAALFLGFPALFVLVRLAFAGVAMMDEELTLGKALDRSRRLTDRWFWRATWSLLVGLSFFVILPLMMSRGFWLVFDLLGFRFAAFMPPLLTTLAMLPGLVFYAWLFVSFRELRMMNLVPRRRKPQWAAPR